MRTYEFEQSSAAQASSQLERQAASTPLLDVFQEITDNVLGGEIISRDFVDQNKITKVDALIGSVKPASIEAIAAIRNQAQGLVLVLARGSVDQFINHHLDIVADPPHKFNPKDRNRYGIDIYCQCPTSLLAVIASPWGKEIGMDLYASFLKAGDESSNWLMDTLQNINTQSSNISPFVRK